MNAPNTTRSRHSGWWLEQVVVGVEAPEQVLGQLDAVDPDQQAPVAHLPVELGQGRRRRRPTWPPARRSSGSVARGDTKVRAPAGRGRSRCRTRTRRPSVGCGSRTRGGPPGPRAAPQVGVGQHPHLVGSGEGGVGEVHGAQVGATRAQPGPQQAQVVVLHQHDGVGGCLLGHGLGEGRLTRGRPPRPRRSARRTGAGGSGRTGRGTGTTAWRCRPRRRPSGRRRDPAPSRRVRNPSAADRPTVGDHAVGRRRWRRRSTVVSVPATSGASPETSPPAPRRAHRLTVLAEAERERAPVGGDDDRAVRRCGHARSLARPGRPHRRSHRAARAARGGGLGGRRHPPGCPAAGCAPGTGKMGGCTSSPRPTSSGAPPPPRRWPRPWPTRSPPPGTRATRCRWPTAGRAPSRRSVGPTAPRWSPARWASRSRPPGGSSVAGR